MAAIIVGVVASIVFVLIHIAPGDPFSVAIDNPNVTETIRQRWRHEYGLDQPLGTQYIYYLANVARGNLGWSFSLRRPVVDVLAAALPNTILLTMIAIILGFLIGIWLGVVQAARAGSRSDRISTWITMFFFAMPDFWLALMILLLFAYWIPIFPVGGAIDPAMHDYMSLPQQIGDRLWHLVLPVFTLALLIAAEVARYQRGELLKILPEDYIRTAYAKGVPTRDVLMRHALRNALIPVINLAGLRLPLIFAGAVFVERVFAWPGMGWTIVNAVSTRDYPLVLAGVIVGSAAVAIGSLLADIMSRLADPRTERS